jgi:hypothetical protein
MTMNHLFFMLTGLLMLLSFAPKKEIYQVLSQHPHDVEKILPYISTVKKAGRLWLVEIHQDLPVQWRGLFRPTSQRVLHHSIAPRTKNLQAPLPLIKEFTQRVRASSIRADVEKLCSFKTRATGTLENQQAVEMMEHFFKSLGLTTRRQCFRSNACNVIAEREGKSPQAILLMAHIDSVGKKFAGADDNASGVAVLMEVARAVRDYDNQHTLRFFITNGEEQGLTGARYYVDSLKRSGEIKDILLAINMDMVGYNSNGFVELETDGKFQSLALWFSQLVTTYTKLNSKITLGAWGSDHVPFINADIPSLLTIEDWSTKTPCYHAECDLPNTLNYDYAAEIGKLNVAAMISRDRSGVGF